MGAANQVLVWTKGLTHMGEKNAGFAVVFDEVVVGPLSNLVAAVGKALPLILYACAVVAVGYLLATLLRKLTQHALRAVGADVIYRRLAQRHDVLGESAVRGPSDLGGLVVY